MCKIILPYLTDVDWISLQQDKLTSLCNLYNQADYHFYQSSSFIDGTGYMERVYQEIDFVIHSNLDRCHINDVDVFMRTWGFEDYAQYKLSELSGGWKKFLGLALFTNIQYPGKIYFDAFRQLSDRLIGLLLMNMKDTPTKYAYFFEYDTNLFPQNVNYEKVLIDDLEAGIVSFSDKTITPFTETNY